MGKHPKSREEAKRIIHGIVHLANESSIRKTLLFKVFYFAHLFYWQDSEGVLTTYPIARLPNGPGIHGHESLLQEMEQEGLISQYKEKVGPYDAIKLVSLVPPVISEDEKRIIKNTLDFIGDRTAVEVSDMVHEYSRTWRNEKNGEILDIYLDLLSEEEWEENQREIDSAKVAIDEFYR